MTHAELSHAVLNRMPQSMALHHQRRSCLRPILLVRLLCLLRCDTLPDRELMVSGRTPGDEVCRVSHLKGMTMDETTTAIHEAGHAVAWARLFPTRYVMGVSIVPDYEDGSAGSFEGEHLSGDEGDEHLAHRDAWLCAGYAAVLTAGYSEDEAAAGCDSDFDDVHDDLATAKSKALELMNQTENVAAVKCIAEELMQRRALHPDHVTLLLDLSDGEVTESEYQQLLFVRGWSNSDPTLDR
jgi:hypothetical protein